jgi:hypothetical protein
MSTKQPNPLYENFFPQGGFHILDPSDPDRFSEISHPDREFDFQPTYPEVLPDGSVVRAVLPGFERGYGLDSSGPPAEWYSNRGERAEDNSEKESPFYHLYQYDSPAMTMETLGDTHKAAMAKDPAHFAGRDYPDNPDPSTWGELQGLWLSCKVNRAKMFRTICGFIVDCPSLKVLNKGYWRFRSLVDNKYAHKVSNPTLDRFLTSKQVKVIYKLFRARRENLRAG